MYSRIMSPFKLAIIVPLSTLHTAQSEFLTVITGVLVCLHLKRPLDCGADPEIVGRSGGGAQTGSRCRAPGKDPKAEYFGIHDNHCCMQFRT